MKKILPFFSYLLHPIFIPVLGTIAYVFYGDNLYDKHQYLLLFIQVIIITFFLPLSFFYLLRTFGRVDTIMLSETSQRKIPLLLQIILTVVLIEKSVTINHFFELYFFFLGGIISTIIAFILVFAKVKASIHIIGISALTFFVIGLSLHFQINGIYAIALLFFSIGIVASSRIEMKAHSFIELVIGFLIGMIPQILLWYLWL
ncbi:MAG: hypothetical protein H7239_09310 [Flavobacterium sp.]|nr:hypothetical protein [Flavobacterium sp.]